MEGTEKLLEELAGERDAECHTAGMVMFPPFNRDKQYTIAEEDASAFRGAIEKLFADNNIKGEVF